MKNKPEYYAGSKLTVYNKYLLIMSYTNAFYFEEAIFNFYYVCKSFRNLLIRNYQVIEKNAVRLPIQYFWSSHEYFIRSSIDRFRNFIYIEDTNIDCLLDNLGLLSHLKNANHYKFYEYNHILIF